MNTIIMLVIEMTFAWLAVFNTGWVSVAAAIMALISLAINCVFSHYTTVLKLWKEHIQRWQNDDPINEASNALISDMYFKNFYKNG